MKTVSILAIVAALMLAAVPALAQDFRGGGIIVEQPWSRATPKGAPVAGGYMVIHNNGKTEDRLTGGTFAEAGKVQIHEMSMENGIMKMRELPNGLAIPPGGTVTLDPDGNHLMFMSLKQQLQPGETVKGELDFEHAGKIAVEYKVGGMADKGPGGSAGTTGGSMPMSGSSDMNMQMQH